MAGLIAAVLALVLVSATHAATWSLTDAQFLTRSITVDSIDSAGIHTGNNTIAWDDVLELTQGNTPAAASTARLRLLFRGGDSLGGSAVSFNGDNLQWNNPRLGNISFPIDSLLGIVQSAYAGDDVDAPRTDDMVRLANGDSMHGIVNQITPAGVTIQVGDATPTLSWDAIGAVLFSSPAGGAKNARRMFRLRLSGDEAIEAPALSLAGNLFTITFADKSTAQLESSAVTTIEQLNGPVSWLSSRKPSENIYKPFFSENFPARFDRTVGDGKRIAEKYPNFHHGIGCHSYSKLTWPLDGTWAGFRTQFAIDSESPLADVTVRIYLDDKPVFEQKNVKAGRIFPVVMIPLGQATRLSLEVDYGENYATEDRFVWLDPALLRKLNDQGAATQP